MSGDPHKKKKKSYFGSYDTLIILFLPLFIALITGLAIKLFYFITSFLP